MNNQVYYSKYKWENVHENITCCVDRYYDIWNRESLKTLPANSLRNWHFGLKNISSVISEAEEHKKQLRCVGGRWSLSDIAMNEKHFMLNTQPLDIAFIGLDEIDLPIFLESKNFVMAQCGVSISQLNKWLFEKRLALPTSGASDGQTIVGAMSTGTHGSAINIGSIPDYIEGLHLLTGSNESYWIEGKEKVLSDSAVKKFCGETVNRINDDTIFHSSLVSLGSFGVIFSVLIKAELLYQLNFFQRYYSIQQVQPCIANPTKLANLGLKDNPHHFELIINPYKKDQVIARAMYKMPLTLLEFLPTVTYGLGIDIIELFGKVSGKIPKHTGAIMHFIDSFLKNNYKEIRDGKIEYPGNIFSGGVSGFSGKGMSTELGVNLYDSEKALNIIYETAKKEPLPGLIGLRYIKKSKALFSMAQFDITCTIEIPAAYSKQTEKFYSLLWDSLDKNSVGFTFHWGQMNNLNLNSIQKKWGEEVVQKWLSSRRILLKTEVQRKIFSNDFLIRCGLNT